MQVTPEFTANNAVRQITITVNGDDDPHGDLTGLVVRGRLSALLAVYADPDTAIAGAEGAQGAYEALTRAGTASGILAARVEHAQLLARDCWGMSWRTIAAAMDAPTRATSIRRAVRRLRVGMAHTGAYIDAAGTHTTAPAAALAIAQWRQEHGQAERLRITVNDRADEITAHHEDGTATMVPVAAHY